MRSLAKPDTGMTGNPEKLIGLLPAAGRATRVAPLPGSKELFPVGFGGLDGLAGPRPKVAAHYLLEKMRLAGACKAYIILRQGKWDIPAYFGDGRRLDMHLGYLIMGRPFGVPYTLDQAYPFIRSATIVFGFPDIVFSPKDAYVQLLERLTAENTEMALAVFKARQPEKMDMLELDARGRILGIDIKPQKTRLTHTWIAAAWKPVFTEFLHAFVDRHAAGHDNAPAVELHMGDVIGAAVAAGIATSVVRFDAGRYLDIGTPEDLAAAAEFVRTADNGADATHVQS